LVLKRKGLDCVLVFYNWRYFCCTRGFHTVQHERYGDWKKTSNHFL